MADDNDKLSLHIASKNVTAMSSGFMDISVGANQSGPGGITRPNSNGPILGIPILIRTRLFPDGGTCNYWGDTVAGNWTVVGLADNIFP